MPRSRPPEAGLNDPKDWICLAVVGAPKGVRGAVRADLLQRKTPKRLAHTAPFMRDPAARRCAVRVIESAKPGQIVVKISRESKTATRPRP